MLSKLNVEVSSTHLNECMGCVKLADMGHLLVSSVPSLILLASSKDDIRLIYPGGWRNYDKIVDSMLIRSP